MKETIFDVVKEREEIPEGTEGFMEIAKRAPTLKDSPSFLNDIKDYGKTILKGTAEGLSRLGGIMGPIQDLHGKPYSDTLEKQTEVLDELLPTDEGFVQKSLRRGLQQAPTAIAMPGSNVATGARAMLAGVMGQGAEELGLPEWAQTAAEITAYIGPDIMQKLLKSGSNKEIIEAAKKFGLSDEQITPLIQSEFKQKWLSKLSPKRGSTETALQNTKKGLSEGYETLKGSTSAAGEITEKANGKLINSIMEKMDEMPREVRAKIQGDLEDLLNNKITGKSLMNFHKDVNSKFGGSTKQIQTLKDPIKEAIHSISPELAKDFDTINNLMSKYYSISSKLKPSITSDLIRAGEALTGIGAIGSAITGYYVPLVGIFGEQVARKVAQQMLLNPRLQQISKKMVNALNENKFKVAKKLTEAYANQIRKESPEFAKELDKITLEDYEKLLNQKGKEE